VPIRPLVLVSGLTAGDYALWNWSLSANHDVLALLSGLTLPPLAVAVLWLLVLTLARLITGGGSVRSRRAAPGRRADAARESLPTPALPARRGAGTGAAAGGPAATPPLPAVPPAAGAPAGKRGRIAA
jgi:hypothetical protein